MGPPAGVSQGSTLAGSTLMSLRGRESVLLRNFKVDSRMLRGVRVNRILSRCGAFWRSSAVDAEAYDDSFAKSELVGRLDDFISHDWSAARWKKHIALCVVYNTEAAVVMTLLIVLLLRGLFSFRILPAPPLTGARLQWVAGQQVEMPLTYFFLPVGLTIFWLFFFLGQDIRQLLCCCRRRRIVFVDKACIEQSNPQRKRRGILMLAGFLAHSDRLVVLWSPRYLTRLWCVYEIATWLYIKNNFRDVDFLPLSRGVMLALDFCAFTFRFGFNNLGYSFLGISFTELLWLGHTSYALIVVAGADRLATELKELPSQLENFEIRDSKCFCCTNDHSDPATKQDLPCDRKLVYSAIGQWFGQEREAQDETESDYRETQLQAALDSFDVCVRTDVLNELVARSGIARYSLRDAFFFTTPGVIYFCDYAPYILDEPFSIRQRWYVYAACLCICCYPCMGRLRLDLVFALNDLFDRIGWSSCGLLRFLLASSLYLAIISLLFWPLRFTLAMESPVPFYVTVLGYVLLTLWLYGAGTGTELWPALRRRSKAYTGSALASQTVEDSLLEFPAGGVGLPAHRNVAQARIQSL